MSDPPTRPRGCARRWGCGTGRRWPTWHTSRSHKPRSLGSRSGARCALERRIDADLALGRHADLVAELEGLVGQHPLRERLRGQRMLALYRCGRQAEALEAFREARRLLVEEIGVEPGPELRGLHEAILRQDAALEVEPEGAA